MHLLSLNQDGTGVDGIQGIDAADQGGLAGTGRTDNADHLAFHDIQRYALQYLEVAK